MVQFFLGYQKLLLMQIACQRRIQFRTAAATGEIDELLLHIQLQEQKHAQITKEPQPETQQVSDEITQDQIESLLADNTEEPDADPKPITDFEPAEETIEPEIESTVVS